MEDFHYELSSFCFWNWWIKNDLLIFAVVVVVSAFYCYSRLFCLFYFTCTRGWFALSCPRWPVAHSIVRARAHAHTRTHLFLSTIADSSINCIFVVAIVVNSLLFERCVSKGLYDKQYCLSYIKQFNTPPRICQPAIGGDSQRFDKFAPPAL